MQLPTEPVPRQDWTTQPEEPPDNATRWLSLVQRFSYVRAHISIFAAGSVFLLTLNLLANPARVQVDRWIIAWALIVVIHAIVAGIAALALQLMADDDIRPASEVRWEGIRSWALRNPATDWPAAPEPLPADPEPDAWPEAQTPPPAEEERVSWQAASDAAWLADAGREQASPDDPATGDDAS